MYELLQHTQQLSQLVDGRISEWRFDLKHPYTLVVPKFSGKFIEPYSHGAVMHSCLSVLMCVSHVHVCMYMYVCRVYKPSWGRRIPCCCLILFVLIFNLSCYFFFIFCRSRVRLILLFLFKFFATVARRLYFGRKTVLRDGGFKNRLGDSVWISYVVEGTG